jgi:ribonuclease P protein component
MQTLRLKREFDRVFSRTGRWITRRESSVKIRAIRDEELRFAISVSRKCGNAVRRNKVRRQVKEIFRQFGQEWCGHYVVVATKQFVSLSFNEKKQLLQEAVSRFLDKSA